MTPTKLTLGIEGSTREGPTSILVQEDFDVCLERFWPVQSASSNLESRTNNIFTLLNGNRILIKTPAIILIEENAEISDDDD